MKNTIKTIALVVLALAHCKEKDIQNQANHQMPSMTKVVMADDLQVAFDLTTMEKHRQMMKSMNIEAAKMPHAADSDHAMVLSILDKETKKPVKGAEVSITMTHSEDASRVTKKASIMEGGGMYHYGTDFKMHQRGTCTFIAQIKANGKTYEAKGSFQMKY